MHFSDVFINTWSQDLNNTTRNNLAPLLTSILSEKHEHHDDIEILKALLLPIFRTTNAKIVSDVKELNKIFTRLIDRTDISVKGIDGKPFNVHNTEIVQWRHKKRIHSYYDSDFIGCKALIIPVSMYNNDAIYKGENLKHLTGSKLISKHAIILVCCHHSLNENMVAAELGLDKMNYIYKVQACNFKTNQGVYDGVKWLLKTIRDDTALFCTLT
jgi:hypothetical protein